MDAIYRRRQLASRLERLLAKLLRRDRSPRHDGARVDLVVAIDIDLTEG